MLCYVLIRAESRKCCYKYSFSFFDYIECAQSSTSNDTPTHVTGAIWFKFFKVIAHSPLLPENGI